MVEITVRLTGVSVNIHRRLTACLRLRILPGLRTRHILGRLGTLCGLGTENSSCNIQSRILSGIQSFGKTARIAAACVTASHIISAHIAADIVMMIARKIIIIHSKDPFPAPRFVLRPSQFS